MYVLIIRPFDASTDQTAKLYRTKKQLDFDVAELIHHFGPNAWRVHDGTGWCDGSTEMPPRITYTHANHFEMADDW